MAAVVGTHEYLLLDLDALRRRRDDELILMSRTKKAEESQFNTKIIQLQTLLVDEPNPKPYINYTYV